MRPESTPEHTSEPPLVSIIIPSYNQGQYIRDTIESCLSQDYRPIEILIIDGASEDSTLDVLRSYESTPEVAWISEKDSGVAEAVNKGLKRARGEFAGIQSSDDTYNVTNAVSQAVGHLQASPELGLVYSDWIYVDAEGRNPRPFQTLPYSLENFLSSRTLIPQHATFFRLALAQEVGGWDDAYFVADTEMWLRMLFRAEGRKVDAMWGLRRQHPEQRDTQAAPIAESYGRMVDQSKEIASAPRRIQQAAKCGKYVVAGSYNPSGRRLHRTCNYWRAFLAYPIIAHTPHVAAAIFPGYWFFKRRFARLQRAPDKIRRILGRVQ